MPQVDQVEPLFSSEEDKRCGICKIKTGIYKCPGCHMRTCSMTCSKGHSGSFGEKCGKNKAIPKISTIDEYTSEKLAAEYRFLGSIKTDLNSIARLYPHLNLKLLKKHSPPNNRHKRRRNFKNYGRTKPPIPARSS